MQNAPLKKNTLSFKILVYGFRVSSIEKKNKKLRKESATRCGFVGYGGAMGKTKPLTAAEQAALEEGWVEIGESIAGTIVVGKRTPKWAWDLIGPLGLYKRWMIDLWVERYKQEHPELQGELAPKRSRKPARPAKSQSKFTKREQIMEALKMLNSRTGR